MNTRAYSKLIRSTFFCCNKLQSHYGNFLIFLEQNITCPKSKGISHNYVPPKPETELKRKKSHYRKTFTSDLRITHINMNHNKTNSNFNFNNRVRLTSKYHQREENAIS